MAENQIEETTNERHKNRWTNEYLIRMHTRGIRKEHVIWRYGTIKLLLDWQAILITQTTCNIVP